MSVPRVSPVHESGMGVSRQYVHCLGLGLRLGLESYNVGLDMSPVTNAAMR